MRIALVHDWLTGLRGGERVLDEIAGLFPDADLYTLFHVPGSTTPRIDRLRIHTSPLDRVPGRARHYRKLLPLFPWAIRRFRLEGYDLVLSTHHAVAKAVPHAPDTPHLCYCFTPLRFVWDQSDAYLGRGMRRWAAAPLIAALRRFDRRSSGPDQVTRYVAISRTVQRRIRRHWGREAGCLHPPVDVERVRPNGKAPEAFHLLVSAFAPYKRDALAIEAFRGSGRRLVVVGDGPGRAGLERRAPPEVEFTGRIDDAELSGLYARCRALIHPQVEDFGITALEAQAAGRPVIAFGAGGALETVIPWGCPTGRAPTGLFFHSATPEGLTSALGEFDGLEARFDAAAIRRHAESFAPERFRSGLRAEIEGLLSPESRPSVDPGPP